MRQLHAAAAAVDMDGNSQLRRQPPRTAPVGLRSGLPPRRAETARTAAAALALLLLPSSSSERLAGWLASR
eukprot:COSAG01_NODE_3078_length_6628_cov_30.180885_9_plen_71_part_00